MVSKTQVDESQLLIDAMLAEKAPEPGTLRPRDVLSRGDDELPMPIITAALTSAGYAYIYDTTSGERSLTNRNMLKTQLDKKRPDGSSVFSIYKPAFEPKRGQVKCMLHASNPNRASYDALGLPVCPKSNLLNDFQLEQHMAHRHRVEWATIQREKQKVKEDEEFSYKQAIIRLAEAKLDVPTKTKQSVV